MFGGVGGHRVSGGAGIREDFCQTEVENFGVSALGDKNICGFDVAMNDPFCVGGFQSVGYLLSQRQNIFQWHRLATEQLPKRFTFQILHGDERTAVLFTDVVNGANIRVIQRGGGLRF